MRRVKVLYLLIIVIILMCIKETSQRHLVNWKQHRVYISTADVNKALQEAKNRME